MGLFYSINNQNTSQIASKAGYIEKIGTGINRIKSAVKEHGINTVKFVYDEHFFKVIFFRGKELMEEQSSVQILELIKTIMVPEI